MAEKLNEIKLKVRELLNDLKKEMEEKRKEIKERQKFFGETENGFFVMGQRCEIVKIWNDEKLRLSIW